jgi:hypothetical protein
MQNLGEPNGQGQLDPKDEAPWYMKYGIRGLGTVAGGLAMFLGALDAVLSFITLSPTCIIFSIWQLIVGFGVLTIESPCCCFFVDHVQAITARVESKPLWMKAALFVVAPLPSILFCFGVYTLFGSGLIVVTGVLYAFMALGKKASREEMARNAQVVTSGLPFQAKTADKAYLVENLRDPAPNPVPAPNSYQPNPSKSGLTNSGPPPPYTDLQETIPIGWDTPFKPTPTNTQYSPSASVTMGANTEGSPVPSYPSDPYNPFQ